MSKSTEEFISNFFLLEGQTLRERHRNFRKLLNDTQIEKINLSLLHPKSPLEEIFKIDAAIYFRDHSEIIKILKSGHVVFIKRILKTRSSHLLNEIFEDITGEELMQLFPHLSLNSKLKVLNKLDLGDTKRAEEFFEILKENYGLYMASKIITSCSGEFITRNLKENKIEITCRQLLKIVKSNPNFIEGIINALHENHTNEKLFEKKYKKVFVYIMKNDLELFLKLREKYKYETKFSLGYRASKSFLKKENTKLLTENSKKLYQHLKKDIIYKNLNWEDFDLFFSNLFPKSSKEFKENLDDLLKILNHSKNISLFFKMFKNVYGCYLHSEFISIKLLELMTAADREVLMENYSRPTQICEEHWISFMRIEISIPMLKQKISLASKMKSRVKIVPYLVLTCKLNDDIDALSEACKYMTEKHHNDHCMVRQTFLKSILKNYNLTKLQEDHWESIYQLIKIGIVNKEYYYQAGTFLTGYIQFRLSKGLPIEEQLATSLKIKKMPIEVEDRKHQKQILSLTYDLIDSSLKDSNLMYGYIYYLDALRKWNDKYPEDKFILYTYTKAMDHLKLTLKNNECSWGVETSIVECLKLGINDEEKNELLNLYFSCKTSLTSGFLIRWLTRNDPMFILDHAEVIIKLLVKSGRIQFFQPFTYYSHLGIPQKMCEVLKESMDNQQDKYYFYNESNLELSTAIRPLSYLLSAKDFLDLTQTYYPTNLTMDVLNESDKRMSRSLKAIAVGIRNVFPSSLTIEPILKFCKGDYLNLIQKSLYLITYNIAENRLQGLLDELSIRAVSVRKHPLHLGSKVLNKNDTYSIFNRFKDDQNVSIRKCLLSATFNFFCNNPHRESWELLCDCINNLDSNDQEALDVLVQWKKVPKSFYGKYVLFTWEILENTLDDSSSTEERKGRVLDLILTTDIIKELPEEFIATIIRKYFLQSQLYSKINSLTVKYIINSNSPTEYKEKLEVFMKLFAVLRSSKQSQKVYDFVILMHKRVFDFIKELCTNLLNKRETIVSAAEILADFIELFEDTLEVGRFLDEYLYLQFTSICVVSKTVPKVSGGLQEMYKLLLQKIGVSIVTRFCEVLRSFTANLLLSKEEDAAERNRYALMDELKKSDDLGNTTVLIVFLLPDERPVFSEFKLKYNDMIQYLLKEEDKTVRIYLHKYLKSLQVINNIQ